MRFRFAAVLLPLLMAGCAPDFSKSPNAEGPAIADGSPVAHLDDQVLIADDGTRLPLEVELPCDAWGHPTPVRTIILAVHGFNDRKSAFEMAAELWRREGIATIAYDQRGFGANPHAGRWPGSHGLAEDLVGAIRAVRARYPAVPVYVLGESMGGAVAIDALAGIAPHSAPDGLILAAPAIWGRDTETLSERVALWIAGRIMPSMRFTGEGLGVEASDNIPMLRRLGADPLFIKETRSDAIYGLVDLMDEAVRAAPRLRLPTLLLYGAHDEVIPEDAMRELIARLPGRASGRQRVAYYRDGWHMLLRDLEYPVVAEDVIHWIADPGAPLPSGADKAGDAFVAGEKRPKSGGSA
ncbi:MAG TPA: alpha/beta fold hydrolase [Stellaceae bacterium]|nr:alpha/beta fold hydrolase [Stellaceae bacterium]